jgi:hypothetical protein
LYRRLTRLMQLNSLENRCGLPRVGRAGTAKNYITVGPTFFRFRADGWPRPAAREIAGPAADEIRTMRYPDSRFWRGILPRFSQSLRNIVELRTRAAKGAAKGRRWGRRWGELSCFERIDIPLL